jgi:hypothetical protein
MPERAALRAGGPVVHHTLVDGRRGRHHLGHISRYNRSAVDQDGCSVEVVLLLPRLGSESPEDIFYGSDIIDRGPAARPVRHGQQLPRPPRIVPTKGARAVLHQVLEDDGHRPVPRESAQDVIQTLRLRG